MASKTVRPLTGFTRLTLETGKAQPSGFILQDTAGNDWYLWFDTSGVLRIAEAATAEADGFNWNTGGTKVGTQT
jgi:hypothetical protein